MAGIEKEHPIAHDKGSGPRENTGGLHLGHIVPEIGPGEIIAEGIELFPPEGIQVNIGVQQRGQDGKGEKGGDQQLLLPLGNAALIDQVQEGDHQEQPGVHYDIPGVAAAVEVDHGTDDVRQGVQAVLVEVFQQNTGDSAQQVHQINPHIAQIIPGGKTLAAAEIAGEQQIEGDAVGDDEFYPNHGLVRCRGEGDGINPGVVQTVDAGDQEQRQAADQVQIEIAFLFSHGLLL